MAKTLNLTLKVWRQENREAKGRIETYAAKDIPVDASFLEMLDIVNEGLVKEGKEPIHFDHDCREGICGMCSLTINGIPHGPERQVTTCQLHMRKFKDGDTVWIEPFRAKAFPILRDLMVDRSALDRIIASGGYIDVRTGSAPNANNIAVEKVKADAAFDAAACIRTGCSSLPSTRTETRWKTRYFIPRGAGSSLPNRNFCIRKKGTGKPFLFLMNPRRNCCTWLMSADALFPPLSWRTNAPCSRNGKSVKNWT